MLEKTILEIEPKQFRRTKQQYYSIIQQPFRNLFQYLNWVTSGSRSFRQNYEKINNLSLFRIFRCYAQSENMLKKQDVQYYILAL